MRGSLSIPLLAMTAVLLWLGAFSLWAPTSPEVLSAAGAPPTEQVTKASGYGLPIDQGLFAVLADEDAAGDELAAKAGLLLTVLVLWVFFGPILRELLASCRAYLRTKGCLLVRCCFHCVVRCLQGRPVVALLAVFRL